MHGASAVIVLSWQTCNAYGNLILIAVVMLHRHSRHSNSFEQELCTIAYAYQCATCWAVSYFIISTQQTVELPIASMPPAPYA